MNDLSLVGHLARDPHTRFEEASSEVTTFTLVMTEPGTHSEPGSLSVGCERDGQTSEGAATRSAEDLVRVEGPWQYRAYTDKQGAEQSIHCVLVRSLAVLGQAHAEASAEECRREAMDHARIAIEERRDVPPVSLVAGGRAG